MWHLQAKAIDEALELFQVLVITQLPGTTKRTKERLSIPIGEGVLHRRPRGESAVRGVGTERTTLRDIHVAASWAGLRRPRPEPPC
ncbi:hypothetical protein E4K10_46560 [Streptomyces sp. T1317-0309]|nr:hypothetical protein E4K10_46560 [Streptomyces sp. T1317-0309]